ncbi:MAG: neutral/alkaline non-lysosomal ceramidase N-terminal domain-containing protein [Clostridia bacterium]|nr:neutral/alkaline non-lysosomal ceramidase N-terminal domain-containing protein [Clostridia bacterium]
MKRIACLLLSLFTLGSLVACGGPSLADTKEILPVTTEEKEEAPIYAPKPKPVQPIREEPQGTFDPTGFSVGFGRYVMTPPKGASMAGFGNSSVRLSDEVLDELYVTCVAVRDEDGKTALLFSVDACSVPGSVWKEVCARLETEVGVSREFVFLNASHTHSGPELSLSSVGGSIFMPRAVKAAKDAIATLDRAEIYIGETMTENMSYVRRYLKADGSYIYRAKIPSSGDYPEYRHETDPDKQMRVIRFDRANQKDVVLMNWACHVTTVGSANGTEISADWVGSLRDTVEKTEDVYFSYFQAAAGNTTPGTRLASEKNNANDHVQHGKDLAVFVSSVLDNMTKVESGRIRAVESEIQIAYATDTKGFSAEAIEAAAVISSLYSSGQQTGRIDELVRQYGFASAHDARTVLANSKREPGSTNTMNLGAIAIGDLGFCYAPYEMLSTTGIQVKAASPFAFTFMCGYTNGSYGYIPNIEAFPNYQYEVDACKYAPGTAEQIAAELNRLLNQIK